jgi:hypothetical protein
MLVAFFGLVALFPTHVAEAAPIGDNWIEQESRCVDCCEDLLLAIHTNARRLDTGEPLVWSDPVSSTSNVPIDFELHYEKSTGTYTPLVLTGTINPDGTVVQTSGNWPTLPSMVGCQGTTGVAGSMGFDVLNSFRSSITKRPECGQGTVTDGTEDCFVDTDWEVAIARRLRFTFGVSADVFCLKKVRTRIDQAADSVFNQELPGICTGVDDFSLCATPWADFTVSTVPPNEVDCLPGNFIDICAFGEFLPLSMGSCN